jgi:hypothetical protein
MENEPCLTVSMFYKGCLKHDVKKNIIKVNPFCVYCESQENLTIDHIHPIHFGGKNNPSNITVACISCNSRKHTRSIDEFLKFCYDKREDTYDHTIKQLINIYLLRKGAPLHYMHNERDLSKKIKRGKRMHTYLTKIINSLINEKYKIFKDA